MKASKANLLQFLQKAGTLEVPVYQRSYKWNLKQCQQLWEDIVSLARNNSIKSHFLGMVVYIEEKLSDISFVETAFLIDGQQRLTTISLILAAIANSLDNNNPRDQVLQEKIRNCFLFNLNSDGDQRYKLKLNREDNLTFRSILDNTGHLPIKVSKNILRNYEFFKNCIINSKIPQQQILSAIHKLEIIDIALQRDIDNPQLIFDSLNSTGMCLSQVDQIRNYVLMGLEKEEQEDIYDSFWAPMEFAFNQPKNKNLFEPFLKDYLTIQNNGEIPNDSELYSEFIRFFNEKLTIQSRKDVLSHVYKYSRYYLKVVHNDIDDPEIHRAIQQINLLGAKDAYPFLMEVMEDYENGLINAEILGEILKTVESFIHKRINSEDKSTFSSLSKNINKMLALRDFTPRIIEEDEVQPVRIKDLIRVNE